MKRRLVLYGLLVVCSVLAAWVLSLRVAIEPNMRRLRDGVARLVIENATAPPTSQMQARLFAVRDELDLLVTDRSVADAGPEEPAGDRRKLGRKLHGLEKERLPVAEALRDPGDVCRGEPMVEMGGSVDLHAPEDAQRGRI